MTLRIFGAILVIAGCAGVGFSVAAAHRREEYALQQLINAARFMACELQYQMCALPELCCDAAHTADGVVSDVFERLSAELGQQISPDAATCMEAAVTATPRLPEAAKRNLLLMGQSLGRFDLTGQLSGLESMCQLAQRDLDGLHTNRDVRLRSYQTLGLCAGIALAILFI